MATKAKLNVSQMLRNIVCIVSMGFVFPNALMEEIDRAALVEKELMTKPTPTPPV